MLIKTRKQAMLDGDNTYYTGIICKNGHLSYRYVQSGTCYHCVNPHMISSKTDVNRRERLQQLSAAAAIKHQVKDRMPLTKVRLFARYPTQIDHEAQLARNLSAAPQAPDSTPPMNFK